jgi:hypothetical protein
MLGAPCLVDRVTPVLDGRSHYRDAQLDDASQIAGRGTTVAIQYASV